MSCCLTRFRLLEGSALRLRLSEVVRVRERSFGIGLRSTSGRRSRLASGFRLREGSRFPRRVAAPELLTDAWWFVGVCPASTADADVLNAVEEMAAGFVDARVVLWGLALAMFRFGEFEEAREGFGEPGMYRRRGDVGMLFEAARSVGCCVVSVCIKSGRRR